LKDGEYEYLDKKHAAGIDYSLGEIFYLDLNGDNKKEAVVFLHSLSCGGSCSGGESTVYFFDAGNPKPAQLAAIDTGCASCGCDLKSFSIANKEIRIEQFGCADHKGSKGLECKFCIEDRTITTYRFRGNKLHKISTQTVDTDMVDVMNYSAEISISE
jgi:hypothetical protein